MKKYMRKSNKNGFTIIEFVLAMAFSGVILVAVCLITIQITNIYQKGLSLRAVNAVGREIMDDITKTVAGSAIVPNINPVPVAGDVTQEAIETARAKYFVTNNIGDSRQASGVFCTGSFDYIWNTADVLNGVAGEAITITTDESRTFTPKLARIPDTTRQHCTTTGAGVPDITGVSEDSVVELINDDEADLALYDFTVYPAMQSSSTRHIIYGISFIIATKRGGININENGDYCTGKPKPYDAEAAGNEYNDMDFNYCAVNRFDFVARQTGESSEISGYGN